MEQRKEQRKEQSKYLTNWIYHILSKPYKQWRFIRKYKKKLEKLCNQKSTYEIYAIIERLCISLRCIYGNNWMRYDKVLFDKASGEFMSNKKIEGIKCKDFIQGIEKLFADMNAVTEDESDDIPELDENTLKYRRYTINIDPKIWKRLLKRRMRFDGFDNIEKLDSETINVYIVDITCMFLRMECMFPRGQQWALPSKWFKKNKPDLICFSSPINVQMSNTHYCSIDPEDVKFGSLGDAFKLEKKKFLKPFIGKKCRIQMNPPFVESILENAAQLALNFIEIAIEMKVDLEILFTGPDWTKDPVTPYYPLLVNSKYLCQNNVLGFQKHYYEDCMNGTRVNAYFASRLLVLSVNPVKYDNICAEFEVAIPSTKGKYGGRGTRH